ncbi:MAG: DUF4143 domain-containing protein [Candidatus Woesearchaeota archaeon]
MRHTKIIFDLFRLLCERVGKQISYNKIGNILGIDHQTVSLYIQYFTNSYLFYEIERKGKVNQRIKSNKKIYCSDIGLRNNITGIRDLGAIYENLVFNHIKQHKPYFIYEQGYEIDFAYQDTLIEAKYGQLLEGEQKELFDNLKYKNKIIANDHRFFLC